MLKTAPLDGIFTYEAFEEGTWGTNILVLRFCNVE